MVDPGAPAWAAAPRGPTSRRRSPFSRLSFGHAVMITAGLLAFLLNVLILRDEDAAIDVPVAAHAIPAGSRLDSSDISYRHVDPDGAFVDRALSRERLAHFFGQVVVRDVAAGAPLMEDDLRPIATPDGQRAMSIPISPDRAVGAALHVGDRIDVMLVQGGTSRFVASGVEVLAVTVGTRGLSGSGFGLTVSVSPVQALLIASALDSGSVHVLRSTGLPAYRGYPAIREARLPALGSGS